MEGAVSCAGEPRSAEGMVSSRQVMRDAVFGGYHDKGN